MKGWIDPTEANVGDYFDGVMIPVRDPLCGDHQVPGWRCKGCGWTVGTSGLPPSHHCDPKAEAGPEVGSLWRHVKTGNVYIVTGAATLESDLSPLVLYRRADDPQGCVWARALTSWRETVTVNDAETPRFVPWGEPDSA